MSDAPAPRLDRPIGALAAIFAASGALHLVRPQVYEPLIPDPLPGPRRVVEISGVAELVCAAGLLHPRTRRLAGLASAAVLIGVFPGNLQMTLDAGRRVARRRTAGSAAFFAGTLARLPVQWPMIRTALRAAGR